jgi:acetyl-CoA C-acetyltransferase
LSLDPRRTPVLVGLGQSIEKEAVVDVPTLAGRAARAALDDAPGLESRIQRLTMVASSFSKVGRAPASEVASELGLAGAACEVTTPGGNTPQWLMNRACEEISRGALETTLIAGAEATRSMRLVDKDSDFLRAALDQFDNDEGPADPIVGKSVRGILGSAEIEAQLIRPAETYPIFENVLAQRAGQDPSAWRMHLAALYSRGTEVAAKNPYAWFRDVLTPAEIAAPTPANRLTAEPYTKRMNSFANVDLGAALLVTTLAVAREAGLEDRCLFPWAGAEAADVVPSARPDLGASPAIRAASTAAFEAAGVGLDEIDLVDIYSCFPVAVELSADAIGLALDDARGLTTTGFMSFFGGPGNNYTTHGIACSAAKLREGGRLAYVTGNGGILSKHAIGIYGASPRDGGFVLADTSRAQRAIEADCIPVANSAEGDATVEGATVVYDRVGDVVGAPIIASLRSGHRIVAVAEESVLPELAGRNLVGETVRVSGASPPVYRPRS